MDELELVRLHEDGDHLVVAGPDGAEHLLPITDALRAAVRGDRPRLESIRAEEQLTMRPRDIQARLRAGATAAELAAESGMPPEQIRRFEYPVASEREHAVGRVRAKAVMSDDGGTATIGDLADKRLKGRGSLPGSVDWTATREGIAPWVVTLRFAVEAGERTARWSFDPRGGAVVSLDDEARWLSLPEEDDGGPVSRTVTALPPSRGFGRLPAPPPDETDLLLDGLSERRGQRPQRGPEPAGFDAGDLDLDQLSPRRRRPDPVPVGTVRPAVTPADGRGDQGAEAPAVPADGDPEPSGAEPAAAVVDLGARREKNGRPVPAEPAGQPGATSHDWEAPSQWDIPGQDDDERRPRTAALKTGGPLTGAVPKPITGPHRSVPADRSETRKNNGAAAAAEQIRSGSGTTHGEPAGTGPGRTAEPPEDKKSRRKPARRGRAQVPSWDEIVFGSRPEG
ncbi:septation protein SepH [Myceligenerans crystallogenes]|uniref:Septation protein SepH n=1 Tax=Myceligenerans crystallogenes TaxID=316335 RepID=A0ABN2NJ88_9MICO